MHISLDSALGREQRLNSLGESVLQIAPSAATAYSLRSLTGGDPRAVRVRRSSDDAEQDFTVSGINSAALVNFVNSIQTVGTSVESASKPFDSFTSNGNDGFTATNDSTGTAKAGFPYTFATGNVISVSFDLIIADGASPTFILSGNNMGTGSLASGTTFTSSGSYTQEVTSGSGTGTHIAFSDGNAGTFTISNFKVTSHKADGFVDTWYDQSANDIDVVQATAASQPKIVSAGSLVTGGLRFDDAQFLETAGTFTFANGTTLSTFLVNKSDKDQNAYLFRFSSNYIVYNTTGGGRKVFAGTNATAGTASGDEELWSTISTINSSGGTSNFFADGTLVSSADANIGTSIVSPARKLNIGGNSSSNHWNGTVNEVIFYDTDQTSNRPALDANIISHYGIS